MITLFVKADKSNKDAVLKEIAGMTKDMQKFANELGYELEHPFWQGGLLRLSISAKDRKSYNPKIYVETGFFDNKIKFKIQTTSYGALDVNEYQKFLESAQNAYKLAEYFNSKELQWLKDYFPTVEFEKGEFAASVKIRGIASREGVCSTQALELPCLFERRVYEEAKKKGFSKYKEVTLSGHLETWPLKNDRHGNMKIMLVCDYVMDIM